MTNGIATAVSDGVLEITLDRPEKKNAMTSAMYATLTDVLRDAETDDRVRVVTIKGAGDSFCAGNDLGDFLEHPPTGIDSPVMTFLRRLMYLKKPVVAAAKGNCVGIGTTLLLHCDLVYAAEGSRFLLPFVDLALCPEAASSFLLPLLAGRRRASAALLLGEAMDVSDALDIGLVNAVTTADDVEGLALEKARLLAGKPAAAVRATRALIRDGLAEAMAATFDKECAAFAELVASPDAREAFNAFLEKRPPRFGD